MKPWAKGRWTGWTIPSFSWIRSTSSPWNWWKAGFKTSKRRWFFDQYVAQQWLVLMQHCLCYVIIDNWHIIQLLWPHKLSLVMFCQVVLSDCSELICKISFKPANPLHSISVFCRHTHLIKLWIISTNPCFAAYIPLFYPFYHKKIVYKCTQLSLD